MTSTTSAPVEASAASHVAAVSSASSLQLDPVAGVNANPWLHTGVHAPPAATESVQSPTPPFIGAAEASHVGASHVAAVYTPPVQLDPVAGVSTKPSSQVGVHEVSAASVAVQSPTAPCAGAPEASQESCAVHVERVFSTPLQRKPSSVRHALEHPSPFAVLPSSQLSSPCFFPSPHVIGAQLDECSEPLPDASWEQTKPASSLQEEEQPSPSTVLPSSHPSWSERTRPSPQVALHILGAGWD